MSRPSRRQEMSQMEEWIQSKLSAMSAAGLPVPNRPQSAQAAPLPWQNKGAANTASGQISKKPVVYTPTTTASVSLNQSAAQGATGPVSQITYSTSVSQPTSTPVTASLPSSTASYSYGQSSSGSHGYPQAASYAATYAQGAVQPQTDSAYQQKQTQNNTSQQNQQISQTTFSPQTTVASSYQQNHSTNFLQQKSQTAYQNQSTFYPPSQSGNQSTFPTPSQAPSSVQYPSNFQQPQLSANAPAPAFNQPPPPPPVPVPPELKGAEDLLKLPPPPPPSNSGPELAVEQAPDENVTFWSGATGTAGFKAEAVPFKGPPGPKPRRGRRGRGRAYSASYGPSNVGYEDGEHNEQYPSALSQVDQAGDGALWGTDKYSVAPQEYAEPINPKHQDYVKKIEPGLVKYVCPTKIKNKMLCKSERQIIAQRKKKLMPISQMSFLRAKYPEDTEPYEDASQQWAHQQQQQQQSSPNIPGLQQPPSAQYPQSQPRFPGPQQMRPTGNPPQHTQYPTPQVGSQPPRYPGSPQFRPTGNTAQQSQYPPAPGGSQQTPYPGPHNVSPGQRYSTPQLAQQNYSSHLGPFGSAAPAAAASSAEQESDELPGENSTGGPIANLSCDMCETPECSVTQLKDHFRSKRHCLQYVKMQILLGLDIFLEQYPLNGFSFRQIATLDQAYGKAPEHDQDELLLWRCGLVTHMHCQVCKLTIPGKKFALWKEHIHSRKHVKKVFTVCRDLSRFEFVHRFPGVPLPTITQLENFIRDLVINFRSTGKSEFPMDNGPPTVKSFQPFQPYKGHIAGAAAAMVQQKAVNALPPVTAPAPVPAPAPLPVPPPTGVPAPVPPPAPAQSFGGNPLKRSSILEPPEVVAARMAAMENPSKTKSMAELAKEIQQKLGLPATVHDPRPKVIDYGHQPVLLKNDVSNVYDGMLENTIWSYDSRGQGAPRPHETHPSEYPPSQGPPPQQPHPPEEDSDSLDSFSYDSDEEDAKLNAISAGNEPDLGDRKKRGTSPVRSDWEDAKRARRHSPRDRSPSFERHGSRSSNRTYDSHREQRRRSRSRERRSLSRDGPNFRRRRSYSRERRGYSRERRSHSRGRRSFSGDRWDHGRDYRGHSRERRGHSRERRGHSRERRGYSRERRSYSRGRRSLSRERPRSRDANSPYQKPDGKYRIINDTKEQFNEEKGKWEIKEIYNYDMNRWEEVEDLSESSDSDLDLTSDSSPGDMAEAVSKMLKQQRRNTEKQAEASKRPASQKDSTPSDDKKIAENVQKVEDQTNIKPSTLEKDSKKEATNEPTAESQGTKDTNEDLRHKIVKKISADDLRHKVVEIRRKSNEERKEDSKTIDSDAETNKIIADKLHEHRLNSESALDSAEKKDIKNMDKKDDNGTDRGLTSDDKADVECAGSKREVIVCDETNNTSTDDIVVTVAANLNSDDFCVVDSVEEDDEGAEQTSTELPDTDLRHRLGKKVGEGDLRHAIIEARRSSKEDEDKLIRPSLSQRLGPKRSSTDDMDDTKHMNVEGVKVTVETESDAKRVVEDYGRQDEDTRKPIYARRSRSRSWRRSRSRQRSYSRERPRRRSRSLLRSPRRPISRNVSPRSHSGERRRFSRSPRRRSFSRDRRPFSREKRPMSRSPRRCSFSRERRFSRSPRRRSFSRDWSPRRHFRSRSRSVSRERAYRGRGPSYGRRSRSRGRRSVSRGRSFSRERRSRSRRSRGFSGQRSGPPSLRRSMEAGPPFADDLDRPLSSGSEDALGRPRERRETTMDRHSFHCRSRSSSRRPRRASFDRSPSFDRSQRHSPPRGRRGPSFDRPPRHSPNHSPPRSQGSTRGPSFDRMRGSSFERTRGASIERRRGPSVERRRGPSFERTRGPSFERRGPSIERRRGPSFEKTRGPSFDRARGSSMERRRGPSGERTRGPSFERRGPSSERRRGPSFERTRGPSSERRHSQNFERMRGPSSERRRGPSCERTRGPSFDRTRGPSFERRRGPSIERRRSPSFERTRGPSFDRSSRHSPPRDRHGNIIRPAGSRPPTDSGSLSSSVDREIEIEVAGWQDRRQHSRPHSRERRPQSSETPRNSMDRSPNRERTRRPSFDRGSVERRHRSQSFRRSPERHRRPSFERNRSPRPRRPSFERERPPSHERNRPPSFERDRPRSFERDRPSSVERHRHPSFDRDRRPSMERRRRPSFERESRRSRSFERERYRRSAERRRSPSFDRGSRERRRTPSFERGRRSMDRLDSPTRRRSPEHKHAQDLTIFGRSRRSRSRSRESFRGPERRRSRSRSRENEAGSSGPREDPNQLPPGLSYEQVQSALEVFKTAVHQFLDKLFGKTRSTSYFVSLADLPYNQRMAIKQLSRQIGIEDLSIVHSALSTLAALPPDLLALLDAVPQGVLQDSGALYAGMMPRQLVDAALGGKFDHNYIRRLQHEQGLIRRTRGANAANITRLQ